MKRFLVLLLAFIPVFLPASPVAADPSVPDDVLSVLSQAVERNTDGRGGLEVSASGYSEDGSYASLMLSYGGKDILLEFYGNGRSELLSSLSEEVGNLLFYEESLYSDAPVRIDYILPGSYSFISRDHFRLGSALSAVDTNGRVRGRFLVGGIYDGAVLLDPVYLDDPFPGMVLAGEGEWKLIATASTAFDFRAPEAFGMVSLGRTDLIYPFVPIISLAYRFDSGMSYGYGGVGLEAYLGLSGVFPSSRFTLVEEGRIGASASVLVGGGTGFDWRSVFSIFYEHRASPAFFWRLGYVNLQGTHMLSIAFGGDL